MPRVSSPVFWVMTVMTAALAALAVTWVGDWIGAWLESAFQVTLRAWEIAVIQVSILNIPAGAVAGVLGALSKRCVRGLSIGAALHAVVFLVVVLFASMGLSNYVKAEDPEGILQRRVGTWITETTSRKAEWTPEETTTKGEETIRWILDKRVLVSDGWSKPNDQKSTGLMVYDPQAKQYRSWWFDNKGVFPRSDTTGTWDAETETLRFQSDLGYGNKLDLKLVYTDKDRFDWTMIIRNQDGRLMMDVVGHTTRKH